MELNAKNCLGPSHESIEITHMMQMYWFDEHVHEVTDFCGERFTAIGYIYALAMLDPDWRP